MPRNVRNFWIEIDGRCIEGVIYLDLELASSIKLAGGGIRIKTQR